ncbi:carboxymethylenebutenolidase [Hypoxylon sp. EC38]|nr:carboxymethylenebutenolidase [Hypoxylon sp. EC38]
MASESDIIIPPSAPLAKLGSQLTIVTPLSRRGHGPGLLLLVDENLDLRRHNKTLDPPPQHKWAEEGYAVAQLRIAESSEEGFIRDGLRLALSKLSKASFCDQTQKIGIIGKSNALFVHGGLPSLGHIPGDAEEIDAIEVYNIKRHYYAGVDPFFAIPAHEDYHATSASVAHTRTLSFLKPLVDGPYFDIENIWDEHTYWEFKARSVEETMATMVEEPYVNHIPTLTGGVGRRALTDFYRDHFIFSNPPDTELELVSRTVGIDRVVDEFLFKATHDRVIDWLAPGIPATGRSISVPFTSVVNIRGDRLYHEHINWDQATLLRQLGLLPDYLPFPYSITGDESVAHNKSFEYRLPVAGIESAHKFTNESSVESNTMFRYEYREVKLGGRKSNLVSYIITRARRLIISIFR